MKINPSAPLRATGLLTLGLTAAILTLHAPAVVLMIPELSGQMPTIGIPAFGGGGGSSRVSGGDISSLTNVYVATPSPEPSTSSVRPTPSSSPVSSGRVRESEERTTGSRRRTVKESPTGGSATKPINEPTPVPAVAPTEITAAPVNPWELSLKAGWSNDFYFRGQNVFDRVSPSENNAGMATLDMSLVWKDAPGPGAITLGAAYLQSLEPLLPNGAAGNRQPNANLLAYQNERFSVSPEERYQELNFSLGYTFLLPTRQPGVLGLNLGVNHYRFLDGRFWQKRDENAKNGLGDEINSTTESELKLFYLPRLGNSTEPLFKSTLGWWHDFDGFEGDYLELGLEKTLPLKWLNKSGTRGLVNVTPFVNIGYDLSYTGEGNSWNGLEAGVRAPIQLGQNLFLNVRASYNFSLDGSGQDSRADEGFAASVSFSSLLGGPLAVASMDAANLGKGALIPTPELTPWAFSGGVGWRNWDVSFKHRPVTYYNVARLYKPQVGGGDLGFADGRDAHYLNGSVYGSRKNNVGAAPTSGGEPLGSRDTSGSVAQGDRQVRFESKRYEQTRADRQENANADDDDQLLSPYLKLSRELGRKGPFVFDLALVYAFTAGEFDSGTRLSSVSSAFETSRNYGFIYSLDEVNSSSGNVIVNAKQYNDEYQFEQEFAGFLQSVSPQRTEDSFRTEKVRVASFTKSRLSLEMHELALPVGVTADLGTRWHVGLSAGPTLNLVNTRFDTDIDYRQLNVALGSEELVNKRSFQTTKFGAQIDDTEDNGGVESGQPIAGGQVIERRSASSSASSQAVTRPKTDPKVLSPSNGGKGEKNLAAPRLTGTSLGSEHRRDRDQNLTWGITGQATITFDIDAQDRWFVEAWGRYQWLDDLSASNEFGSVEIDPSNFSVGMGIGYRF